MDALLAPLLVTASDLLGPAWLPLWTLVKIMVIVAPLMIGVAYLTDADRKAYDASRLADVAKQADVAKMTEAEKWRTTCEQLRRVWLQPPKEGVKAVPGDRPAATAGQDHEAVTGPP